MAVVCEPEALLINSDEGYILFDDDSEALVDLYIDSFGVEIDDPEKAVAVVGRFSKGERVGEWVIVDLTEFVSREVLDV